MACEVTWLQKGNRDEIARLAALATAQQKQLLAAKPLGGPAEGLRSKLPIFPFDTMITPWESKFGNDPDWHFVSKAPDGRICGWLTAQLKEIDARRYIYLAEISTRRIRDELYGGVGRRLHEALLDAARQGGYDFIYLYPVNAKVAAVYEGWGYSSPVPGIPHQFYVIKRGPTKRILGSLMTQRPNVESFNRARALFGQQIDEYRRAILAEPGNVDALNDLLTDFEVEEANIPELVERPRREKQRAEIAAAEAARLENQRYQMSEFLKSLQPKGGGKTARNTHRLRFLRKHHLPVHGYSLGELSKVSKVSQPILQQVYDRGIGAYKTNPTSVRMKGTFRKGVKAPYSKKLSKEQWAMARVYSFLDGYP
jgi:GNAT superfamily N-acetyltransferase